jgi:hypothetical protein
MSDVSVSAGRLNDHLKKFREVAVQANECLGGFAYFLGQLQDPDLGRDGGVVIVQPYDLIPQCALLVLPWAHASMLPAWVDRRCAAPGADPRS